MPRTDHEITEQGPIASLRDAQYAMDKAQLAALKYILDGTVGAVSPGSMVDDLATDLEHAVALTIIAAADLRNGYWRRDLLNWNGEDGE